MSPAAPSERVAQSSGARRVPGLPAPPKAFTRSNDRAMGSNQHTKTGGHLLPPRLERIQHRLAIGRRRGPGV